MASNRELKSEIASLSAELGEEVSVEGMNNAKLSETLETLRAKKAMQDAAPLGGAVRRNAGEAKPSEQPAPGEGSAPADGTGESGAEGEQGAGGDQPKDDGAPPADPPAGPDSGAPPVPAPSKGGYVVAPGKVLTTKKGVRTAGTQVTEKEFANGADTIRDLASKGYLVRS